MMGTISKQPTAPSFFFQLNVQVSQIIQLHQQKQIKRPTLKYNERSMAIGPTCSIQMLIGAVHCINPEVQKWGIWPALQSKWKLKLYKLVSSTAHQGPE